MNGTQRHGTEPTTTDNNTRTNRILYTWDLPIIGHYASVRRYGNHHSFTTKKKPGVRCRAEKYFPSAEFVADIGIFAYSSERCTFSEETSSSTQLLFDILLLVSLCSIFSQTNSIVVELYSLQLITVFD